jgi:hypothetical protein
MNPDLRAAWASRTMTMLEREKMQCAETLSLTTRAPYKDGTHLQHGFFQPVIRTVTHPPWIGLFLSFVFRLCASCFKPSELHLSEPSRSPGSAIVR